MLEALLAWLLRYLVHSTLLLGAAWAADRAGALRRPRLAEIVWRAALFGGLLTASLQGPVQSALDALQLAGPGPALVQPAAGPAPVARPAPPLAPAGAAVGWPHIGLPAVAASLRQPDEALAQNRLVVPVDALAPAVVGVWLLVVGIGVAGTLRAARRLQREVSGCAAVDDADALRVAQGLARRGRPPRLHVSRRWNSPLVTAGGQMCLPAWAFTELSPAQREAVIAHEMAHLQRRDPQWRLTAHLVSRVGWMQPLNCVAARRLEAAAELLCDDWAATRTDRRHELAEALYLGAQRVASGHAPALAVTMARPRSPLLARVESLLEQRPMSAARSVRAALLAALVLAFGGLLALPVIAVGRNTSHLLVRDAALSLRIDGDIVFDDAETDVLGLSDHAVFQQTGQGHTRSIEFQAGGAGHVRRQYRIDGRPHAMDAQAQAWLAALIPQVLRRTAWHAPERLARIRARQGVDAAIDEIALAPPGFARAAQLRAFMRTGGVDDARVARLLALAGTVDGGAQRSALLIALVGTHQLGRAGYQAVLASAQGDGFDTRGVLEAVAAAMPKDAELIRLYHRAARGLGAPERGEVERALDHLDG